MTVLHKLSLLSLYAQWQAKTQTFPKLPFPRRDRKLKSENRMTSWWMTSGCSIDTRRCLSSRETDYRQNTKR